MPKQVLRLRRRMIIQWRMEEVRFARCANAHLSDDKTVAKMGHPVLLSKPGSVVVLVFEAGSGYFLSNWTVARIA
jgi:hypothetical protein